MKLYLNNLLQNTTWLKTILLLPIVAMIVLGRFYDDRLQFFGIDVSIFVTLIYAFSIVFFIRMSKGINKLTNYFFISLLSFLIVLLFSYISSNYTNLIAYNYGFEKLTEFILIHCCISICILLSFDIDFTHRFIQLLLAISACFIIAGLIKVASSNAVYDDLNRLSVMGGGPIVFARWVLTGALITIIYSRMFVVFKFVIVASAFYLATLSGSKGPIGTFVICIGLYALLYMLRNISAKKIMLFIGLSIVAVLGVLMLANLNILPSRLTALLDIDKLTASTSFLSRFDRIANSINIIKEYKNGIGLGNWASYYNYISSLFLEYDDYPHNIFMEITAEAGWVALLLFVFIITIPMVLFFKNKKTLHNTQLFIIPILVIFNLINCNFSGDLSDSRQLFIFCTLLYFYTQQPTYEPTTL